MPDTAATGERTSVLIVGGGPAGLVLAIELGQRGIDCVLVEQAFTTSNQPKANLSSARTMEHYRRVGFADEVRAEGLPPDYPQDRARALYERDLVLVRPDHHVCWRGNTVAESPEGIIATVAGWSQAAAHDTRGASP